jgi:hypothetical protein
VASKITVYSLLPKKQFTGPDGSEAEMPVLVQGDQVDFVLKPLDVDSTGAVIDGTLNVRTLTASIGTVLNPPAKGQAVLAFAGSNSNPIAVGMTVDQVKSAISAISGIPAVGVVLAPAVCCWLVKFNSGSAVELTVATNTLFPTSFARWRAYQVNGVWWHELRFIVSPVAFTSTFDRVLAPAPSIAEVRVGSAGDGETIVDTNEVQSLAVPAAFNGTYYLIWNFQSSQLIGTSAAPSDIAAALNGMFTDGVTRFSVTNPEAQVVYIEFVGPLSSAPQPLIQVSVNSFAPGDLNFTLDLDTPGVAAALRASPTAAFTFEVRAEVCADGTDASDPDVPAELVTLFQVPVTITREQGYSELETVPDIDWITPPTARSYVPFNPDQVITGQQFYVCAIGDGASLSFNIAHGLGTDSLHCTVRQNMTGGIRIPDSGYTLEYPDLNSVNITFPGGTTPPAENALGVVISTAGPIAAFVEGLMVTIGQVTGLQDALDEIGAAINYITSLLPTGVTPGINGTSSGNTAMFTIPPLTLLYPGHIVASASGASSSGTGGAPAASSLSRPAALPPAQDVAEVTSLTALPLADPTANAGVVIKNNTGAAIRLPGGYGLDSAWLTAGGYAASDGRLWYPVYKAGSTDTYFPSEMDQELFLLFVNEQMLLPGDTFTLEFDLSLALLNACTRGQYMVVIEVGDAPSQTDPSPATENLYAITWNATPLLQQRVILTKDTITHHFGANVTRSVLNILTASQNLYGTWTGANAVPDSANFAIRARLVWFDTENDVVDPRGTVSLSLANATAQIT